MSGLPKSSPMYQAIADFAEIKTTVNLMAGDVTEVRKDVKELREGAPLHRIEKLEGRWRLVMGWIAVLTVGGVVAVFAELVSRL